MNPTGKQGVVILGATSAVARAVAQALARQGCDIVVAARDMEECDHIAQDLRVRFRVPAHALRFDAERFEEHAVFFAQCLERLGDSVDGVVLCSGHMDDQKHAETHFDSARRTIDVNLTGAMSVLNIAANWMEERKSGWIAVVSSVAGDRGRQSNYIYGASKAGLTAYCAGLRNRLYHAGVHVLTVKPGFMDTKMTWGQVPFAATPEAAAEAIVRAIEKRKNVAYVPGFWRWIMLIIRSVPEWQFKRMRM